MSMKVHVIMRCVSREDWLKHAYERKEGSVKVAYCGYLELDNPYEEEIWHWCNWSCWRRDENKPKECEHLNIGHCNSDMAYCINGEWYAHNEHKYNSFSECYAEMTENREITKNRNFKSIWPFNEYIKTNPVFVTHDNINQFINEQL